MYFISIPNNSPRTSKPPGLKSRRFACSCVEYVFVQAFKGLLHTAERQSQVHAYVARAEEGSPVLPRHADVPAGLDKLVQGLAVAAAPVVAVEEEHIGALRLGNAHAVKALGYVPAGEVNVAGQHLPQLGEPLVTLRLVRAYQGVHAQHVHVVVVRQRALLLHPLAQPLVVDYVVAAHKSGQVEGLAGRVHGRGAAARVLTDGLGGYVSVAAEDYVRPYLVGHHVDVVLLAQLHEALDLPALPHPAGGVVRRAEHGRVDAVLYYLPLHILEIHAPDAVLVQLERAVHHLVAIVAQ